MSANYRRLSSPDDGEQEASRRFLFDRSKLVPAVSGVLLMPTALVAFGSNVGDSAELYRQVQALLAESVSQSKLVRASQPIETRPIGHGAQRPGKNSTGVAGSIQNLYLNAALAIETTLPPNQLIERLLQIEKQLGRVRDHRWGPRTVDLDLLLYGDQVIETDGLSCPHPRMSFRKFVLKPAAEIAPNLVHPIDGLTIAELLARLEDRPNLLLWVGGLGDATAGLIHENRTPLGQMLQVIQPDDWRTLVEQNSKPENEPGNELDSNLFWICQVTDAKQFDALHSQAKLLILPCSEPLVDSLAGKVADFRGARLTIDISQAIWENELLGAVDGMI